MIYKCKMCGATMKIGGGIQSVIECEYCGTTQTLPKSTDEQTVNQINRANQLRQNCEFDRAIEIYERILNTVTDDSEIYWNLVLCRYGIEYVEDPASHRRIATCHRTQFNSILQDSDYLSAIKYADVLQKEVYEREAEYIDKIQKGILEISNKEDPFDIFICYKETDDFNKRTPDSVLAQDLYYGLADEGFKVFFSRITLEGKLGAEYEPYIFAALNSAKVMVVVGTKPEYFNAVWVKNEWARFLDIMKNDKNKTLIPAYKDMDPYDLPDALSMFQAQDMSKLGFMQDLIRGIRKLTDNTEEVSAPKTETNTQTVVSSNTENLLKRGMLCLEDGDWKEANGFFEKVLDENVEEGRAYVGKLLAELQFNTMEQLEKDYKNKNGLQEFNNYRKAVRFGKNELKSRLEELDTKVAYNQAIYLFNTAKNDSDFQTAKEIFDKLNNFMNSEEMSKKCTDEMLKYLYNTAGVFCDNSSSMTVFLKGIDIYKGIIDYKDVRDILNKIYDKLIENVENTVNEDVIAQCKSVFEVLSDVMYTEEGVRKCDEKIDYIIKGKADAKKRNGI